MIAIQKFDPKDFDRSRAWDDRYKNMYALQGDFSQYEQQSFWPLLQKKMQKDGRYLDAGCGIGLWVMFLHERGFLVDGIDAHAQAVRAMTEYNPDIAVKIASTDAIPHGDSSFNGVLSIGSLEYSEHAVKESLNEFHRVLKDGGFLLLEVPLYNTLRRLLYVPLKNIERMLKTSRGEKSTFAYYLFGRHELEGMLQEAGFVVEEIVPHDLPDAKSHFGLYANWPLLRGQKPYELNMLGKIVKSVCNAISPWVASAGIVVIAKRV